MNPRNTSVTEKFAQLKIIWKFQEKIYGEVYFAF